jgi:8-oxo-dGTP diphosphatase
MAIRTPLRGRTRAQGEVARVSDRIVRVAAAVIRRPDGSVLLAQRPEGRVYAGYWEFPGGKLEPRESVVGALKRELREELGIDVLRAAPWITREYVYPHAHVELNFCRVLEWCGEPVGHDGQAFSWQRPGAFTVEPLLPANAPVLAALSLPPVYGITCAGDLGEDMFLERAERACARGLALLQIREKDWDRERRDAFARRLVAITRRHRARVLLNGSEDDARRLGCDGVHWTAQALVEARSRPDDLMVGASCHTRAELERAAALEVDLAVLGPVCATPTHPFATPIGFDGFERIAAGTRVPVFALGGLTEDDLGRAVERGAHGVALRRHAWPAI